MTLDLFARILYTTACEDGFFAGYKNWCINHAVDCVENITIGVFPDMILKAHQEYLRGYNAANGSGNSMCPIGDAKGELSNIIQLYDRIGTMCLFGSR
jgi:hypothetical protein